MEYFPDLNFFSFSFSLFSITPAHHLISVKETELTYFRLLICFKYRSVMYFFHSEDSDVINSSSVMWNMNPRENKQLGKD